MKNKINSHFIKDIPLWLKIISIVLILAILLIGTLVVRYVVWSYNNDKTEKMIDQKFHEELSQIPQLKVKSFQLWEGDSIVVADIENKGEVRFWYGIDGTPRIDSIGQYFTSYACFYVDDTGKKTGYAYDSSLVLDNRGRYAKWFPFEVKNLKDIVENYDAINAILATFPKNLDRVPFEDNSGKRFVIKQSNPNYLLKQQLSGKEVWCDLYR